MPSCRLDGRSAPRAASCRASSRPAPACWKCTAAGCWSSRAHYQLERIRLLDDYRVQIEHIKHKCAEAVYQLDQKHKHEMADSNELLGRLNAIRSFD